jgi:hypothetical protein
MPNRRYVERGVVFTPQAPFSNGPSVASNHGNSWIGSNELRRQAVAKFLIRLAREDGSLDATTLRDKAVVALGGVAYRDMAAGAGRDDKALNHRNCPC